jgi:hypothetical protein
LRQAETGHAEVSCQLLTAYEQYKEDHGGHIYAGDSGDYRSCSSNDSGLINK